MPEETPVVRDTSQDNLAALLRILDATLQALPIGLNSINQIRIILASDPSIQANKDYLSQEAAYFNKSTIDMIEAWEKAGQ